IVASPTCRLAASVNGSGTPSSGATSPSMRRRLAVPPAPCAISICASLKIAGAAKIVAISDCRRRAAMDVAEIGGAGALGRHHQRAHGALGRALASEQLALVRLQHALEHFSALRGFRIR